MNNKASDIEIKGEKEVRDAFLELLELCPRCNEGENRKLIIKAFNFAYDAHKGTKRGTGEAFIMHPIEVAKIVVKEIGLGVNSVMCALMHDIVEDNDDISLEIVQNHFGEKIASIIDGLTKITNVYDAEQNLQAETFRKMLMSIHKDIRVILIKLSDRLHNMRTLQGMPENRQIVKAGETLYVYAPLARRLGLNKIGRELEDLSFKYYLPDDYKNLMQIIEATEDNRTKLLNKFENKVKQLLKNENIEFKIVGIRKSLYATWTKMKDKHFAFEDIHNFYSLRLIFESDNEKTERSQCYKIYEIITNIFMARSGSLQDLVKNPKANGFEALIVDIMREDGNWNEIQILSKRMSDIAERGYSSEKQNEGKEDLSEREKWIQEVGNQLINPGKNALEFLDNFKLNLYISEIYVFTPKGKIIKLPKGSTVLDFAFQIHTDLGLNFMAAKVNKKLVNHLYVLNSADQVEIIDSKISKPDKSWLKSVVTARAKLNLKNYFKKENKENITIGKNKYFHIMDSLHIVSSDFSLDKLLKQLTLKNEEHLFFNLAKKLISDEELIKGFRAVTSTSFFNNLIPSIFKFKTSDDSVELSLNFSHKHPYIINESGTEKNYVIADCCNPIPEDKSIAFKNENGEIIVHQINCETAIKISAEHGKSTARVIWGEHKLHIYPAKIEISGVDRKNLLLDITSIISNDMDVNMKSIFVESNNGIYEGNVVLYVSNLKSLNKLILKIKKVKGITSVVRVKF
ncbi:MAG: bifunctional (p)ppGpp synthetase/guanosine-3',5'-bis(diphosphate) 3'-pyrophosphohydrolase [Bacteroidales bacterium]|nr:bifunctional (p)ppGpp synthetase/guanosine-3',5'-bis(diphosphate) 3'-pyrophosphohydrolase [Bacteroidales bacterium]